jgi:hypothetical protein
MGTSIIVHGGGVSLLCFSLDPPFRHERSGGGSRPLDRSGNGKVGYDEGFVLRPKTTTFVALACFDLVPGTIFVVVAATVGKPSMNVNRQPG